MIPTSRYSHPCVVASHTVIGLVWETKGLRVYHFQGYIIKDIVASVSSLLDHSCWEIPQAAMLSGEASGEEELLLHAKNHLSDFGSGFAGPSQAFS